jgi:hypothetical protein
MEYTNSKVLEVSQFLQNYMKSNNIFSMTPDECAEILNKNGILSNKVGPKPGFNFRQMLRDGRDGKIDRIQGASQAENNRWTIQMV